jgi:hypothetical protein
MNSTSVIFKKLLKLIKKILIINQIKTYWYLNEAKFSFRLSHNFHYTITEIQLIIN